MDRSQLIAAIKACDSATPTANAFRRAAGLPEIHERPRPRAKRKKARGHERFRRLMEGNRLGALDRPNG